MSDKREEFLKSISVGNEDKFTAVRVESESIRVNERKLDEVNKEIEETKKDLWSGKDHSHPDAIFAAMFASSSLRKKQEEIQNEIKKSEKFINGER